MCNSIVRGALVSGLRGKSGSHSTPSLSITIGSIDVARGGAKQYSRDKIR